MSNHTPTTIGQDTGEKIDERIDAIKDGVRNLVSRSEERATELKTQALEDKDQVMTRGSAMMERATGLIKEHPIKAVGIAFGIGYLGMRLFRR